MPRPTGARPAVLYLDVDGTLLRGVEERDPRTGLVHHRVVAAPRAREFLRWALERFEVRWCTAWAPNGTLAPADRADLARTLGVPEELLAGIGGRPWSASKLEAIDFDDPRPWWWLDDAPAPADLEALRARGHADRWIPCPSDRDPDALRRARRLLARALRPRR